MNFEKLDVLSMNENTFKLINGDWMLISAKDGDKANTMTAVITSYSIHYTKLYEP